MGGQQVGRIGGQASAVTSACALSKGMAFMPMQAECLKTGDMLMRWAIPSQDRPWAFLAKRIRAVTFSRVRVWAT